MTVKVTNKSLMLSKYQDDCNHKRDGNVLASLWSKHWYQLRSTKVIHNMTLRSKVADNASYILHDSGKYQVEFMKQKKTGKLQNTKANWIVLKDKWKWLLLHFVLFGAVNSYWDSSLEPLAIVIYEVSCFHVYLWRSFDLICKFTIPEWLCVTVAHNI